MRLLQTYGPVYAPEYIGSAHELPPYAILSHTWNHGQEVTFEDLVLGAGRDKSGWSKIEFCRDRAVMDGLSHFWIDSCCIPAAGGAERHAAIQSMYQWYHKAAMCYVALTDVRTRRDFHEARWWTRGWTLQELLAPRCVLFFNMNGDLLGDKATLEDLIFESTSIPLNALCGWSMSSFTIQERRSWMTDRETAYPEDQENCLIGILGFKYIGPSPR